MPSHASSGGAAAALATARDKCAPAISVCGCRQDSVAFGAALPFGALAQRAYDKSVAERSEDDEAFGAKSQAGARAGYVAPAGD
jgi:hypothetical protein